jgi:hypothetical protein
MGDSRIKAVSALLSSFFDEEKLRRGERVADFFSSWPSFVGPRLAAHSRVADVDKGLLVVEAEHPGWIQLLQLRQSAILEEVARRYPELSLRGIAFRLSGQGRAVSRKSDPEEKLDDEEPPREEIPDEDAARSITLEDIPDPDFRALLKRLKDSLQGKA